jgi:hypothetical protein
MVHILALRWDRSNRFTRGRNPKVGEAPCYANKDSTFKGLLAKDWFRRYRSPMELNALSARRTVIAVIRITGSASENV